MADIYGSHFEYGGVSSRGVGLIIANMQTTRMTQTAGIIGSVTFYDKESKRNRFIDTDYTSFPLSFEVEIFTADEQCNHIAERELDSTQRRAIEKWLFNRRDYMRFYLDQYDDLSGETFENVEEVDASGNTVQSEKKLYLNCRFINPERIENHAGTVGWRVTLETDSGLWWQDQIDTRAIINNADEDSVGTFSVTVDTDLDDYTFPRINIYMGNEGGDITLINNSDNETRMTSWTGIPAEAIVTIGGSGNTLSYPELFADKNFPRLLPGENNFTIKGNVQSVRFRWQNRRLL